MGRSNVYKWSFLDRGSIAVINFAVNIALARMLTEADFGLLAMISIFIAIAADLSSCGLSDGLLHKLRPTEKNYSTVFVFNAVFGLLFGGTFFLAAPLIARYFGHAELTVIMRIAGVCFFFQTLSYVQETRMRKQLNMKAMCIVRVSATVTVAALGIIAAALGYGYIALVITQIGLSLVLFIYYTIASRWFPHIGFSVKAFKEFFSYGVHLMLAYMATVVGRNINTSVLGRFYPNPAMSGIYYQGAKLAAVPFAISEMSLNNPFFAVASNEADPGRVRTLIRNMFSTLVSANGILLMFMLVIAAPGIELLYGDKWLAAVPVFRILALAEFLFCLRAFLQTICKVYDRTRLVRNLGFAEVGFQLLLLLIFYRYGLLWIAWTQVLGVTMTVTLYTAVFCPRIAGIRCRSILALYLRALWLPGAAAVAGALAASLTTPLPVVARCAIVAAAYAGTMIALGEIFRVPSYLALRSRFLKR